MTIGHAIDEIIHLRPQRWIIGQWPSDGRYQKVIKLEHGANPDFQQISRPDLLAGS